MSFGSGLVKGLESGLKMGSEIRKGSNTISKTGKSGRSQVSSAGTKSEYSGVSNGMNSGSSDSGDDYTGGSQG